MKDLIFIAGAPGSGKTTIAKLLYTKLKSAYIDFGWLREFHLNKGWKNQSVVEEQMAFDNLIFILRNYIRHGYKNVIITDLKDERILQIPKLFKGVDYVIASLIVDNDKELKKRVLGVGDRDSGFRNVKAAAEWNTNLKARPLVRNEFKINNSHNNPEKTAKEILKMLG